MIAGQLALLQDPAAEPLANYHDSGYRALEVEETQTYLDDELTIQSGMIAGRVPSQREKVVTNGHEIEVEQVTTSEKVATEFVADVDDEGWILAERTHSSEEDHEPDWPFNDLSTRVGQAIDPMQLKPYEFVRNQRDADRDYTVEMASREYNMDDVSIEWGQGALKKDAIKSDVGVALTTHWRDQFVRLVIYGSGYLAIWEPAEMKPELLGRFIHEEIVPIAHYGEDEVEEDGEETDQETLDNERVTA